MIRSIGKIVIFPVAAIVAVTKFLWDGWIHLLMPVVEVAYVLSLVTLGVSCGFLLMYLTVMQVPISGYLSLVLALFFYVSCAVALYIKYDR
jgi:hypothetical protein